MSLDHMNNKNSNLKAIGMFIFGGSASIGVMRAGYNIDRVLEMTDNMTTELNGYHFAKNFKEIPVITPSIWENEEYLKSLNNENYDLLYSNCPCSSLSQINKNASVDGKNNIHFYRVFDAIKTIKPKTFFIENAPTLVKLGYPILLDMVEKLSDDYRFTIIRDYGGNHGVPMKRMRTLVVGWKKDVMNGIPLLEMKHTPTPTPKEILGDLYNVPVGSKEVLNHEQLVTDDTWCEVENLFNFVDPDDSALLCFIKKWKQIDPLLKNEKLRKEVLLRKADLEAGKRLWDKTPWKVSEDSKFPSMTSMSRIIHPVHNRTLTIREYARIMGYPDDFEFFPNECQTPIVQCIAQGVPAPFVKYITGEIMEALNGNRTIIKNSEDKTLNFQHHTHKKYKAFTHNELKNMKLLDSDKTFEKLEK